MGLETVKRMISLTLISLLFAANAFAGEIRIVDGLGLIRASRAVEGENAVVIVKIIAAEGNLPRDIPLVNLDGLAAGKYLRHDGGGAYSLSGLSAGTWRISVKEGVTIKEVKIKTD